MTDETIVFFGGPIFDGQQMLYEHGAVFNREVCSAIVPEGDLDKCWAEYSTEHCVDIDSRINLHGNILSLGYADLQVNGGGGVMFNDEQSVQALQTIANAHCSLGTRHFLPTLITATKDKTLAAIDAVADAMSAGVPGIAGLHLEGPHLSVDKKGAHSKELIRPMQQDDVETLLAAAKKIPLVKLTIAPENVSIEQVQILLSEGIVLALGHTNASYETCLAYRAAGVQCITHLFNAMSQFGSRDPGLVGAALTTQAFTMGLIADGVHVHPRTIQAALTAMGGMGRVYLVSDAMAVAGTSLQHFSLDDRTIVRQNNRLTLADGTLAGADLELTHAIRFLVNEVGVELSEALRSAVTIPRNMLVGEARECSLLGSALSNCITIQSNLQSAHAALTTP